MKKKGAGVRNAQESVHLVAASVGFISFFLLWLAVVSGMVLRNGWALTRIRHSTAYGIHSVLALLGLCLAAVHAFAQLAVPGGPVRWVDTVIPFTNGPDPFGIGLGVIAAELLTAAALSVLVQRRLGFSRWRALHALTYTAFMLLVAHLLISGSDVSSPAAYGAVLLAWLTTVGLWTTTTPWIGELRRDLVERFTAQRRARELAVNVDPVRCGRFGFCQHEAPDVFTLRSDGRLAYRAVVPADLAEPVIRAAEVCPARAITLNRVPTTVLTPPLGTTGPQRSTDPGPAERAYPDPEHGYPDRDAHRSRDPDRGPAVGPRRTRTPTVTGLHRPGGGR